MGGGNGVGEATGMGAGAGVAEMGGRGHDIRVGGLVVASWLSISPRRRSRSQSAGSRHLNSRQH